MATILLTTEPTWNRSVKAFAVGPPPTVDKNLAMKNNAWRDKIFTIVFRDDIVPRLCLHSLFRLRSQALAAFRQCSNPADHVMEDFQDLKVEHDVKRYQTFDFPHVRKHIIDEENVPPLVLPGKVFHLLGSPVARPLCPCSCIPCLRWPIRHSSCNPRVNYRTVVYHAHVETFSEIRVTADMLLDHFPHRYWNALDGIDLAES
eukprot:CAMPEP_0170195046 /NCGR_PEP_ID=MMETSP0040_2-20121228/60637_1 /TAXON_ID=641309 /ORGANISM="Lotharella oceanica, Strain CCMP622" /LENGTH=202 /DNA_ID=CAMNT_0010444113 /DNA_START=204 /DNA_END=812 /DNA_ORIENTATION=-